MKLLRKLFGHDDKFFDLLEACALEAKASVQLLVQLLKTTEKDPPVDEFIHARRKEKRITEEITEQLCKTFVTPLEREDIEALSSALGKIPKTVKKFSEKYVLCRGRIWAFDFQKQMGILEQTTETVYMMVKQLRTHANLEQVKEQNDRLHYLENQADKIMLELTKELYDGNSDPLVVLILLDLYGILEKIIDRCRDAGNIVFQIVLKYS